MSETTGQDTGFVQKIIWGAITFSLAVFLGVALFGVTPSEEQMADMANNPMPMIFFGIGLMEIGLAVFLLPKLLNVPDNPKSVNELMVPRIIQWAVIESGMIMGLVAAFQGAPQIVPLGLFVVAVVGMLKTFPRDIKVASDSE